MSHENALEHSVPVGALDVHFQASDAAAVIPLEDVIELLDLLERVKKSSRTFDPTKLAQLAAFADRIDAEIATSGGYPKYVSVDAVERSILNVLVAQSRIRAKLPTRIRRVCNTCGRETLENPDYSHLKQRNSSVRGIAQELVLGLMGRSSSPIGHINSALGFLEPDFVCPYCKGMDGEQSTIVFCPGCRALRPELLLTTCPACGHDFRLDADLESLWRATDAGEAAAQPGSDVTSTGFSGGPAPQSHPAYSRPAAWSTRLPSPQSGPDKLIVPAWYDPKGRTVVFDHSTIHVGVLALDTRKAVYTTPAGVQFIAPLTAITVAWLSWAKLTRGCDVEVEGRKYRLYFAKPFEDVADLSQEQAEGLAADITQVMHGASGVVQGGDVIGALLALPGAIKEQQDGIKNGDAVRRWLEAAR